MLKCSLEENLFAWFYDLVLMRQRWLSTQHEDLSRKGEKVANSTFGFLRNQQHG